MKFPKKNLNIFVVCTRNKANGFFKRLAVLAARYASFFFFFFFFSSWKKFERKKGMLSEQKIVA
jgi:hypothetical protein